MVSDCKRCPIRRGNSTHMRGFQCPEVKRNEQSSKIFQPLFAPLSGSAGTQECELAGYLYKHSLLRQPLCQAFYQSLGSLISNHSRGYQGAFRNSESRVLLMPLRAAEMKTSFLDSIYIRETVREMNLMTNICIWPARDQVPAFDANSRGTYSRAHHAVPSSQDHGFKS
jgi:hypothetical protein